MSEAPEAPATDEPLSPEEAIALIDAPEEAPVEAEEPAEEAPAEEAAEPEEEAAETDDEPEIEAAPVNAPHYWDAEAKAKFAALPPDLQEVVAVQEQNRERAASKFIQENSEATKALAAAKSQIDAALEAFNANQELRGELDWAAWLKENPGEALAAQHTLQQLHAARERAEAADLAKFHAEEGQKLPAIDAELAKPERLTQVYGYIAKQGIPQEQLRYASAAELAIAHKAMKWDEAQARARAGKVRTPEPPRKPVKPTSALPGTASSRGLDAARERFAKTRSNDAAVDLIKRLEL